MSGKCKIENRMFVKSYNMHIVWYGHIFAHIFKHFEWLCVFDPQLFVA